MDQLDDEILVMFIEDSREHLGNIETALMDMERHGAAADPLGKQRGRDGHPVVGMDDVEGEGAGENAAGPAVTDYSRLRFSLDFAAQSESGASWMTFLNDSAASLRLRSCICVMPSQ